MGWVRPTLDQVLARFDELTVELIELRIAEGETEHAELGARQAAWRGSQEATVTGRARDAEHASVGFTMELVKVRADIKARLDELRYLDHVIASWRT